MGTFINNILALKFKIDDFQDFFDVFKTPSKERTVTVISLIAVALIICVTAILIKSDRNKNKNSARDIAFAGLSIALAFVLSTMKIKFGVNGGSTTFASFVPLIIYSYKVGFKKSVGVGITYGILQFIESPFIVDLPQFLFDYPLAFSSIALVGLTKDLLTKHEKNKSFSLYLGIFLTYAFRFIMHTLASYIICAKYGIPENVGYPHQNWFIYSSIYNALYLVPDMIISYIVIILLSATGIIKKVIAKKL